MPYPPMTKSETGLVEEIPEHIRKIQNKALGSEEGEVLEIDWEFWHFLSVFVFRFTEEDFFENTTLRRIYSLATQHEKYHKKQNGGG